jgi:hypothetical protein
MIRDFGSNTVSIALKDGAVYQLKRDWLYLCYL